MMMKVLGVLLWLVAVRTLNWTSVEGVIEDGIVNGVFSGCVLAVATHNATLYKKAFGTVHPRRGFYAPPVTTDMQFDINTLTFPVGITPGLMNLYDESKLNTTNRVSTLLFDFDNNGKRFITLEDVMVHNSGLPAAYTAAYPSTPADLAKAINNIKLEYTTETKYQYSELGPFVLGEVILKLRNNTGLNSALFEIFTVMGMRETAFLPTGNPHKIVPGGYLNGTARGRSFSKLTHFMNDQTGASGLYSTADNLVNLIQLLLNKGKLPRETRIFTEDAVERFLLKPTYAKYKNTRTFGWETIPASNPPCGTKFSDNSFGLADPTATYVWTDRSKNVSIIFLANGMYPVKNGDPTPFQSTLSDAIMTTLGY